ncbi:MAG: wax ester/triacylglycerol synthase family O-acyltransferase [Jatrophihabitantaceae bacterium]
MTERLSSADAAFLYLEDRARPQHMGSVAIFQPPPEGFDYDRLVTLLEERISLVPRYRQKVRQVAGRLANPVWVDDPNFDLTYHVRRSALPRPGSDGALLEFCARVQSRLLDRDRPLWEMYLIEGLSDGRVAIVAKTHHAMIDGIGAVNIAQVLFDASPEPRQTVGALWMPAPEPSARELLGEALGAVVRRPSSLADSARFRAHELKVAAGWLTGVVANAHKSAGVVVRSPRQSPLRARPGEQRRIAIARTRLADYRAISHAHGASVNDVVLATVAGGLRRWLTARGQVPRPVSTVRTLVPVSVDDDDPGAADRAAVDRLGRVTALLVDLPIGDLDPLRRLAQVRFAMGVHKLSGKSVGADALVALSGFAPPTLHSLAARAANGLTHRMFSLVVANVPGPQHPLYAARARMTEMFPVLPLGTEQALSIGLTSYNGGVFFGINGDRDAAPDVNLLASCIADSLAELVATVALSGSDR